MIGSGSVQPLLVVGDCLLDVDVTGEASRLCPDEPAPVVDAASEISRPGGAGLAALIAARQREVVFVTALGADEAGERLRNLLQPHVTLVDLGTDRTVVKTRIRVGGRTLLRLDRVSQTAFPLNHAGDHLIDAMRDAPAILVSDYGFGLTHLNAVRQNIDVTRTVWDPHPRGATPVPGVLTVTPNVAEAQHFSGLQGSDLTSVMGQGADLLRRWRAQSVTITRGAAGALICRTGTSPLEIPAVPVDPVDSVGAGDALAAGVAAAVADGRGLQESVTEGVTGAAQFLREGGVGSLFTDRPHPSATDDPRELIARTRSAGGTVVMAGGCFDLLHAGHVAYLEAARSLGDCLIVAVNSDDSVRRLKGPDRPMVPAEDRARMLRALACVDAVEIFDADTPEGLLRDLQPQIFAKGGDYENIPEAPAIREYGGDVVILPLLEGRSSSRLVEAARNSADTQPEEDTCHTKPA